MQAHQPFERAQVKLLAVFLALMATACATPATHPSADQKTAALDPSRVVCRTYRQTGSVMPGKRVCHTEVQWQAIDRQQQRETNTLLGKSGRQNGTGSDLH